MSLKSLTACLNSCYNTYHAAPHLETDPLGLVHSFRGKGNQEIAGLVASGLAYGRVEMIIRDLKRVFAVTGPQILKFALSVPYLEKVKRLARIKHRFNDSEDIAMLLECIGVACREHGSLNRLFEICFRENNGDLGDALHAFSRFFIEAAEKIRPGKRRSFEFLFPSPHSGGGCKRLCMYLRWMVRPADGVDLGIWKGISPAALVVPVDTHIAQFARSHKLSSRTTADWKMACEITEKLKTISPNDPLKFDFSICRAGVYAFRKDRGETERV